VGPGALGNNPSQAAINALNIAPNPNGTFPIDTPGVYTIYSSGPGHYRIAKLVIVSQAQIDAGDTITVLVPQDQSDPRGHWGPGAYIRWADRIAAGYVPPPLGWQTRTSQAIGQSAADVVVLIYTEEINDLLFNTQAMIDNAANQRFPFRPEVHLNTPTFTQRAAGNLSTMQVATIDMAEAWIAGLMAGFVQGTGGVNVWSGSLGTTWFYENNIPMLVFSRSDISNQDLTLEQVADIVRGNDQLTFWVQAGIHGNEPGSIEGAFALIYEMFGAYGASIINDLNVVIAPMTNPDGAQAFMRSGSRSGDMNRDRLNAGLIIYDIEAMPEVLEALDTDVASLSRAFQRFLPELAIDAHEIGHRSITGNIAGTTTGANPFRMTHDDMFQISNSAALNVDDNMHEMTRGLNDFIIGNLLDSDVRAGQFGGNLFYTGGRGFMSILGAAAFLAEGRGIGAGSQYLEIRSHAQYVAFKSIIEFAMENTDLVRDTVEATRASFIDRGTYYRGYDVPAGVSDYRYSS
jgi:hypothetical protein